MDSLPGLKFIAGFNGGVVVRRDFPLKENLLPAPTGEQVVQIVLEHQLDACLYTNRDWFVGHLAAYRVNREQRTVQFPPKVLPTFAGLFDRRQDCRHQ